MTTNQPAAARQHVKTKLCVSVLVLAVAVFLLWNVDSAVTYQYQVLSGCWPESVTIGDRDVVAELFWAEEVAELELGPLATFFFARVRHRILFYSFLIYATVGWAGSVFLRVVTPRPIPTAVFMVASLLLSELAASILFLLLVGGRLIVDPGGMACISMGYAYMTGLGSIGAGLFVVLFFRWFEDKVGVIWDSI